MTVELGSATAPGASRRGTLDEYVREQVTKRFDRKRTSWTDTGWHFTLWPDSPSQR